MKIIFLLAFPIYILVLNILEKKLNCDYNITDIGMVIYGLLVVAVVFG